MNQKTISYIPYFSYNNISYLNWNLGKAIIGFYMKYKQACKYIYTFL